MTITDATLIVRLLRLCFATSPKAQTFDLERDELEAFFMVIDYLTLDEEDR